MILMIRKRSLVSMLLFFCFSCGFAGIFLVGHGTDTAVFAPEERGTVTIMIDPGHGGEDGGAVSPDGVTESQLNLAVSLRINELLRFMGQQTRMTRSEDISICDDGLDTIRARKASDIRNRVVLVNNTENALLLSVHQNSLPSSPVTHGAQVFWNQQEGGESWGKIVQDALNDAINTEKAKQSKKIPDTIYLMKHVTVPAILVECGFLSNTEETQKLQEPSYQVKLATAITAGTLRCLAGEEVV